jgi:hypothetical protein
MRLAKSSSMFAVTQSDDAKALERQSLNLWIAQAKSS